MRLVTRRVSTLLVGLAAGVVAPSAAWAQAEPFIGQIMCAGFNFAPRGWAEMNGQILSISQNTALFSLLGTQYGGNGQTTFALPDMRGRVLLHAGSGPGLSTRTQGEVGGSEAVALTAAQMPPHAHGIAMPASTSTASLTNPANAVPATTKGNARSYAPGPGDTTMAATTTASAGTGNPVPVVPPFVAVKCFIALQGIFPARD